MISSHLRRPDYYAILQLAPGADKASIVSAFRRLARQYHPDANPSADTTSHFQQINEAYRILSNDAARADYDNWRAAASNPSASTYSSKASRRPEDADAGRRRKVRRVQRSAAEIQREFEREKKTRRMLFTAAAIAAAILLLVGVIAYQKISPSFDGEGRPHRLKMAKAATLPPAATGQRQARRTNPGNCPGIQPPPPANEVPTTGTPHFDAAQGLDCSPKARRQAASKFAHDHPYIGMDSSKPDAALELELPGVGQPYEAEGP